MEADGELADWRAPAARRANLGQGRGGTDVVGGDAQLVERLVSSTRPGDVHRGDMLAAPPALRRALHAQTPGGPEPGAAPG